MTNNVIYYCMVEGINHPVPCPEELAEFVSVDDYHNKEIIYEFIYTECIYESGYTTISIHRTKRGAYNAMRRFVMAKAVDQRDMELRYGKSRLGNPFIYERWKVIQSKIMD